MHRILTMRYADLSPEDQALARELTRQAIAETAGETIRISRSDLEFEAKNLSWNKYGDGTIELAY